jgi:hypothetical protein
MRIPSPRDDEMAADASSIGIEKRAARLTSTLPRLSLFVLQYPRGRDRHRACPTDAEGATAPETLRQTDRAGLALWKAAGVTPVHRRA